MGSGNLEVPYPARGAGRDRLGIIAALMVAVLIVFVCFVTMFVLVKQGVELGEMKSQMAQLNEMKAQLSHLRNMESQLVQELRQWREHLDMQVRPLGPSVHEQQNGAGRGKSATFLYKAEVHRRAKSNIGNFANKITLPTTLGDCAAYHAAGQTTSGVYTLDLSSTSVEAYCDMENQGGGWTVIQRRQDGSVPFNRTWEEYKLGFGNLSGEYWLGNENIHLLTKRKNYKLRVVLEDFSGATRFAEYSTFR
ncbi:fibrinogen C domain-containing protein 1-B-like [Branchiostoma floridae x Branchiostoma japonicum]